MTVPGPKFGFWYDRTLQAFQSDRRSHRSAACIIVDSALEYIAAGHQIPPSLGDVRERLSHAQVALSSKESVQKVASATASFLSTVGTTLLELHAQKAMLTTYERTAIHHLIAVVSTASQA